MENNIKPAKYKMVLDNDKTVKQFFERFYVIPREPKNYKWEPHQREFLEDHSLSLVEELEILGKDGYIVTRKKKKFKSEEVEKIKNDKGSQREKAKKYGVSVGTINKIMNDKY